MRDDFSELTWQSAIRRITLALIAAAIYFGVPTLPSARPVIPAYDHFPRLAGAMLHGRLSIDLSADAHPRVDELIPSGVPGRYFCAYPPLPAMLLMPVVAIFGASVTTAAACRGLSVLNVLLFDACVSRMRYAPDGHPPRHGTRVLLDLFFAFGTVTWHNADAAGDWHLAHAVTLAAGLLALREFLGPRRPMWLGAWVAFIILTRPTAALACPFVVLPLMRSRKAESLRQFALPPLAAAALLAAYNAARFGDPLDFGYSRMVLTGTGKQLMDAYGQFSVHYIPRNLFWFFLAPPWSRTGPGMPVGFDPRGLSLFLASPALLYVFVAIRRTAARPDIRDAWVSVVLALVPLLLYFNTGFWQYGHRFSMDYLVALMVLVAIGVGQRPSRTMVCLVGLSILVQAVGIVAHPIVRLPEWLSP